MRANARAADERVNFVASIPFFLVHLSALLAFVVHFHVRDVLVCVGLYYFRMFWLTAGYHRYFSHRSFKTSRVFQFLFAWFGAMCTQKGALWWAANHRHHHRYSDQVEDIHSPIQKGFWWSHVGWVLCDKYLPTRFDSIKDFARFPELRWVDKYFWVPPLSLAVALYFIGGFSMVVWGFSVSTVLLWHGTFTINSLSHVFGRRRYKTTDTSRNNWLLALITCGEGWHNNHHYHQNTANQGWFWWEVDLSYYVLKAFSWVGLVWDLKTPPEAVKNAHLAYSEDDRAALRTGGILAGPAVQAAKERVRDAIAAAADALPRGAPSPALLKRQ